ncbi:hypothetical protein EWM64_g5188 [Hericium alpestre]|uniref:Uncharacterized protein n=1 Tax=Hericium alpestre TaxID=135208 RepID=A0A4Y9ZXC7_9AGAM|nr:hypothetical protein EWM64_g5188 [Hericium alpestre]
MHPELTHIASCMPGILCHIVRTRSSKEHLGNVFAPPLAVLTSSSLHAKPNKDKQVMRDEGTQPAILDNGPLGMRPMPSMKIETAGSSAPHEGLSIAKRDLMSR